MITRDTVIAEIITAKTGGIPEWVYHHTTEEVLIGVFNNILYTEKMLDDYPNIIDFFKKMPQYKTIRYSAVYDYLAGSVVDDKYMALSISLCIFTTKKHWNTALYTFSTYVNYTYAELLQNVLQIAVAYYDRYADIDLKIKNLLRLVRKTDLDVFLVMKSAFFHNSMILPFGYNTSTMELFQRIIDDTTFSHKDQYGVCLQYISAGLPVLYLPSPDDEDITPLVLYLDCIIDNSYRIELCVDTCISLLLLLKRWHVDEYSIMVVKDKLHKIATTLHRNNLRHVDPIKPGTSLADICCILFGDESSTALPITNFNVYVHQLQHVGISTLEMQLRFIENGGSVRSMFTSTGYAKLHQFAYIIKTGEMWEQLVRKVDRDTLIFLLQNSPDFLLITMSKYLYAHDIALKLADAIFVYPVDDVIYRLINNYGVRDADNHTYDMVQLSTIQIILIILKSVSHQQLYKNVPATMLYIQPSVLEFSSLLSVREIPTDHVKFVPSALVGNYVRQIIARDDAYIEFNRHNVISDDDISLLDFVDSMEFIVTKVIVDDEKYAYICDITGIDPIKFIDDIVVLQNKITIRKDILCPLRRN